VLKNTNKLAGSRIRVKQDYAKEVREISRELIPYLKDARSRGHKAVMKKDKLMVNGKIYSLRELKEKIKPVMRRGSMDNPDGDKRQEEETIQQGIDYRETSSRFADSEQGKEGSHCTTEIPKSRREDIGQQCERGGRGEVTGSKEKSDDIRQDDVQEEREETECGAQLTRKERESNTVSAPHGSIIQIETRTESAEQ
jgi:hypothetical protein